MPSQLVELYVTNYMHNGTTGTWCHARSADSLYECPRGSRSSTCMHCNDHSSLEQPKHAPRIFYTHKLTEGTPSQLQQRDYKYCVVK